MASSIAKSVIDEVSSWPSLPVFNLTGLGEPLMNPEFFEIARYASQNDIITSTSTNGMLLDLHNQERVLNSGLGSINISIDGITQATLDRVRAGAELHLIEEHLVSLIRLRKEYGYQKPLIRTVFVECDENRHEIGAFVHRWRPIVDAVTIKPLFNFSSASDEDSGLEWFRKKSEKQRSMIICKDVFSKLRISWDGKITPCLYDCNNHSTAGIVGETSILDAFNGSVCNTIRKHFIHKSIADLKGMGLNCMSCSLRYPETRRKIRHIS